MLRSVGDDTAAAEGAVVGGVFDRVAIVRREHERRAAAELGEQVNDAARGLRLEGRGRLVEEENVGSSTRIDASATRFFSPLESSRGERAREVSHVHPVGRCGDAFEDLVASPPKLKRAERQLVEDLRTEGPDVRLSGDAPDTPVDLGPERLVKRQVATRRPVRPTFKS